MWSSPVFNFARNTVKKVRNRWRRKSAPEPPKTDWLAELKAGPWNTCPPAPFRILSAELREAGRLDEAENISLLGVTRHPKNVWLAIEHAQVANAREDRKARLSRWARVLDLAGDNAPTKVFKNLADSLLEIGEFKKAEEVALRGAAVHPDDLALGERPAKIALAAGYSANAIQHWKDLIGRHPETDTSWIYRRISETFNAEGLISRALETLDEGIARYPEDEPLREARAKLLHTCRPVPSPPPIRSEPSEEFTAHLFRSSAESFGKGVCSFPFSFEAETQHIPAMLDFEKYVAPFRAPHQAEEIDVFVTWSSLSNAPHGSAIEMAHSLGKPHLCVDFGFLGAADSRHSIIVCPDSSYFDATRPSAIETCLNSADEILDDRQLERARLCISQIVQHRISRHHQLPDPNPEAYFSKNGRKRVMLVDQRMADKSVEMGLADEATFQRMLDDALTLPDYEVVILLHPDAAAGPNASYFGRSPALSRQTSITVVDFGTNPFQLFEWVDKVYVCTSQIGFEALMAGKEVHCFGAPYYAGWGLTTDHSAIPRRRRHRTLEEIFHLGYIIHSRYHVPDRGLSEPEDLIRYLIESRAAETDQASTTVALPPGESPRQMAPFKSAGPARLVKVLIIIPSGRMGASGRYLQNLSWSLQQTGCEIMVLAEGKCPSLENGVQWRSLAFEGSRLQSSLREELVAFAPDIIYESGVRTRAQRAALEIMALTGARLAMQSEDDDVQIYGSHHGAEAAQALTLLDKPEITMADLLDFLENADLAHSLNVALNPKFDRWVEPLTRALCYRLASLHTAIWRPFESRLAREYQVPTLVVPPVAAAADFERILPTAAERARHLEMLGIESDRVVIFIGGAIYGYSDEYSLFLEALNQTPRNAGSIQLVVSSARSSLPVARMARDRLRPEIGITDIGRAGDDIYLQVLKACDIVCSPGVPDAFNRFRLPSRLVKAMAMGKPVLTCRCGFGESLANGINAFLMDGTDPEEWAETIAMCLDPDTRARVGAAGQVFARQHFDSDQVARQLRSKFDSLLANPPRRLSDSIVQNPHQPIRTEGGKIHGSTGVKLRDRYATSMQDALQGIAAEQIPLGIVVHIGAGAGKEVEDYCRLGASRIILIDALADQVEKLRELENIDGRIIVRQAAVSGKSGDQAASIVSHFRNAGEDLWLLRPARLLATTPSLRSVRETFVKTISLTEVCAEIDFTGENALLLLELNGSEADALEATPISLLQKFRWIALRASSPALCDGGTTPDRTRKILAEAGFTEITMPANHAGPLQTQLFENPRHLREAATLSP